MTDHGTPRPHLPDPQYDRHVSFPEDAPDERPPTRSLPPEAWAPRPSGPPPTTQSPGPPSGPSFVTAPARPPLVRRRPHNRGAGLIAALVVVPLLIGIMSGGTTWSMSADGSGYSTGMDGEPWQAGDAGPYSGVEGVTILPVADGANVAPLLPEATTVQAVPAGATQLRIEVVASAGGTVQFEVSGPDGVLETTLDEPLPLARIATHPTDERTTMHVHAERASGDTVLQCRVYAGTVLVALDTARSSVTCTVTW